MTWFLPRPSRLQSRVLVCFGVIALGMTFSDYILRAHVLSPQKYYEYHDTEGPFFGTYLAGLCQRAAATTNFHAGQTISWTTHLRTVDSVAVDANYRAVNLATGKEFGFTGYSHEGPIAGSIKLCLDLADDAPPGAYEIRRHIVFVPPEGVPLGKDFPPIRFEVIAP
jgi:hypothetical protein